MVYLSCKTESSVITCRSHKDDIEPAKLKAFKFKELEAATCNFSREFLLGKGSYGWVYKACLRDGKIVAVKRSSIGRRNAQDENPLENELEILSKIRSTRLVNLIGYSKDNKETLLVVDYMANGTLHEILHNTSEPLSWNIRIHIAIQIAKGLRALHAASPPVIHRDIKSSNILIDSDWNARLADFGLALRGRIEDVVRLSTPPAGTMGYLDPGYISPCQLSTKTDVFSFGILLLEIMSGRNAIDVQYYPPNIVDWALPFIKQGRGAEICDPKVKYPINAIVALNEMAGVAARCVRLSSSRRPSMSEVVKELREINRRINTQLPTWNSLVRPLKPSSSDGIEKRDKRGSDGIFMGQDGIQRDLMGKHGSEREKKGDIGNTYRRMRVRMVYAEDKLIKVDKMKRESGQRSTKMIDYLTL